MQFPLQDRPRPFSRPDRIRRSAAGDEDLDEPRPGRLPKRLFHDQGFEWADHRGWVAELDCALAAQLHGAPAELGEPSYLGCGELVDGELVERDAPHQCACRGEILRGRSPPLGEHGYLRIGHPTVEVDGVEVDLVQVERVPGRPVVDRGRAEDASEMDDVGLQRLRGARWRVVGPHVVEDQLGTDDPPRRRGEDRKQPSGHWPHRLRDVLDDRLDRSKNSNCAPPSRHFRSIRVG